MQTFKVSFSFHRELFMSVEKSKLSTTLLYHALADKSSDEDTYERDQIPG